MSLVKFIANYNYRLGVMILRSNSGHYYYQFYFRVKYPQPVMEKRDILFCEFRNIPGISETREKRLVRGDGREICQLDKTIVIVTFTDKVVSGVK